MYTGRHEHDAKRRKQPLRVAERQLQLEWDDWQQESARGVTPTLPAPAIKIPAPAARYSVPLADRVRAPLPAPYQRESDTSREAAASVEHATGDLRARVLADVASRGAHGSTCDETVYRLGMLHQTASARYRELAKLGAIRKTDARRKTKANRSAAVWVAADVAAGKGDA